MALVVGMAVPVMALISDGSEQSSHGMVVSINDTDSFGGAGLQPGEGVASATWDTDELFVPGADMGIGYSADPALAGEEEDTASRHPTNFHYTATIARNGSIPRIGSSGGERRAAGGGGGAGPASPGGASKDKAPTADAPGLRLRAEHCVDPDREISEPEPATYVVASGR